MSVWTGHPQSGGRVMRRGFTLLELITAMAMVAILAGSLYASLRIAFRAQASAEAAVEPARTASLALDFLRNDLVNCVPPGDVLAGQFVGTDSTDDRGHPGDDVSMYTTAQTPDGPSANGEIKLVELLITVPDGSTEHALVRRVTRNLLATIEPVPEDQVVCRGVSGFNVRYWDGTQWLDDWSSSDQSNQLPAAVEVTLELERATAPGQPAQTLRYVRVFPMVCSTITNNGTTTSTGTSTGLGGGQ